MATEEREITGEDEADEAHPAAPDQNWTRRDSVALALVTLIAGALRFIRLDIPKAIIFDETYYAKDACWYVNVSEQICEIGYEQTNVHPPLAKWLIAIGIRLFGFDSFGWRVAVAAGGTITVALLYLLARRIFRSTTVAAFAAGLLAIDLLHFVQSRTSMLDIFVPMFGLAALLFTVYDRDRYRPPPDAEQANGLLDRPWRLAAGACAGAAVASKWPGLFFLALVIVLTIVWEIAQRRTDRQPHPIARFLREETLTIVMWLLIFPVAVYMFTYLGRLEGALLANPAEQGSWFRAFWDRQLFMLDFHRGLGSSHGYQSNPWTWPVLKRPVSYHIEYGPNGEYAEIMATGSPFVWWASILALVYVAFRWIAARVRRVPQGASRWRAEGVIVAGFVFTYGPWLLPSDRSAVFLFYLLPSVPFMCLALAYVATEIGRSWEARAAVALFSAGAIGFFVFYYPVVANVEIPKKAWERRIWQFDNCDKPEGTPTKSTLTQIVGKRTRTTVTKTTSNADLPPKGWCWI
ncbi:MAG: phospholipid carrier-dependent glycosyltransferase [Actinobacteria bacterium]|nr:phospholipid carrier-dependent glycosyltransferase [Actinomycetota bacterium]